MELVDDGTGVELVDDDTSGVELVDDGAGVWWN